MFSVYSEFMEAGLDVNMIVMVVMGASVFMGVAVWALGGNSTQKIIHKRALKVLSTYSNATSIEENFSSLRKQDADPLIAKIFLGLPTLKNVRAKTERLDGAYTLKMFLVRMIITFVLMFMLFKIVFGMNIVLTLVLCLMLSYMFPNMGLNRRIEKRRNNFLKLMPDALDLIVRGLRSGLPVTESMQTVAQEIGEPVKGVFLGIASAIKVGMSFEDALFETAKKLELNEFNFFAISIALQKETGGNLAEILENLSETIRARAMMKLKIKAISSEARASSYIVGALPFIVALVLLFTSPAYLNPLIEEFSGNIALGTAMCMFTFGMYVMRRMAQMEV